MPAPLAAKRVGWFCISDNIPSPLYRAKGILVIAHADATADSRNHRRIRCPLRRRIRAKAGIHRPFQPRYFCAVVGDGLRYDFIKLMLLQNSFLVDVEVVSLR